MKASVRVRPGDTSDPTNSSHTFRRLLPPRARAFFVCPLLICAAVSIQAACADDALDLSAPGAHDAYVERLRAESQARKAEAVAWALQHGMPIREKDGPRVREIMALCDGRPLYYVTDNVEAALSVGADRIRDLAPWNLDGDGFIVGVWDGAWVSGDHPEFQDAQGLSRVTARVTTDISAHATHVAGTIGARGIDPAAKGMAPRVRIESFNWDDDTAKMSWWAADAPGQPDKIYVSNHSYGFMAGWEYAESEEFPEHSGWYWYNPVWDGPASHEAWFGQYNTITRQWDDVAYYHPYYLAFTSSGNDRGDNPQPGDRVFYWTQSGWSSMTFDPSTCPPGDGEAWGGYGTISGAAVAKNVMTVGAVDDAVLDGARGLSMAAMTDFSCWGPTTDGRIKPDIVTGGIDVYSAYYDEEDASNTYESHDGTSMACPAATGAAVLLVQYYDRLFPGDSMRSSTLKGLILHTADDLGRPGPDYQFGWGLMNATAAAELLQDHHDALEGKLIIEGKLDGGNPADEYYAYVTDSAPIRITLCWTDPPADSIDSYDHAAVPRLKNDLDIRVIAPDGSMTYRPYILDSVDRNKPAAAGDNRDDNVEQVYLAKPHELGMYTIRITHKAELARNEQYYSLISSMPLSDQRPLKGANNKVHVTSDTRVATDGTSNPPSAYAISADPLVEGDRPPLVEDMMVFTPPRRAVTFELGAADDGQPDPPGKLSYTVASLPQHGQLNSGGQFLTEPTTLTNFGAQLTYFPDQDFAGRDSFTFYADDGGSAPTGGASSTATVTLMVMRTESCELEVGMSADDACIGNSGRNQNYEAGLLLVGLHTSVLRFAGAGIPPQSEIIDARLKISVATSNIECTIDGLLQGEAAGDAANFQASHRNILELPRTYAAVPWVWGPEDSGPDHTFHNSPNLAAIVQEIVDRPDWAAGNALVLIYSSRVYHGQELEFFCRDSVGREQAKLNITYALDTGRAPVSTPQVSQNAPVAANAMVPTSYGSPVEITLSASDDGLPDPPGGLTYAILSLPVHGELTTANGDPVRLFDLLSEDDNSLLYEPYPTFIGRDRFTFHALDGIDSLSGRMSNPATVTLDVQSMVTREFQVIVDEDDAYASDSDQTALSRFLRVGRHSSGMRFRNVDVPPGSEIVSAFLKVSAGSDRLEAPVAGSVWAEAALNPADFADENPHLYDRAVTDTFVPWTWQAQSLVPRAWYTSDDIGAVVQEIVDQPAWLPGNSIAIVYSGDAQSSRDIQFFGCAHPNFDRAAKLQITFDPKGASALDFAQNPAVVEDMKIETAYDRPVTITLNASDDGLPDPPGKLAFTIASLPSHGTLENPGGEPIINPGQLAGYGNEVIYRPFSGFFGEDGFTFQSNDGGIAPLGGISETGTVTIVVRPALGDALTDEFLVVHGADDAYAIKEPAATTTHTQYLFVGPGSAAMRFWNVDIPWGSLILDARLKVCMSKPGISDPFEGVIRVQDAGYPVAFTEDGASIYDRSLAEASVPWDWTVDEYGRMTSDDDGAWCTSPDIAEEIQQIIDRPDWLAGNPLVVVYASEAYHGANISFYAYDYIAKGQRAPRLEITYVPAFGAYRESITAAEPNQSPPVAQDMEIKVAVDIPRTITLNATDDGLPNPPGLVTYAILSLPGQGTLEDTYGTPITEPTLLRETNRVVYVPASGYIGQDAFTFCAHDRGQAPWGGASETAVATIFVKTPITREYQVCAPEDDASTGGPATGLDTHRRTLEVGIGSSGIRFRNIDVPRGSTIASAYLRVCRYSRCGRYARATLYGEAADNAKDFQTGEQDLFDRPRTEASTPWPWESGSCLDMIARERWYDSPPITKTIQEITDRRGWSEGNAIVILYLTDKVVYSQDMHFFSFDNDLYPEDRAPKLEITYVY